MDFLSFVFFSYHLTLLPVFLFYSVFLLSSFLLFLSYLYLPCFSFRYFYSINSSLINNFFLFKPFVFVSYLLLIRFSFIRSLRFLLVLRNLQGVLRISQIHLLLQSLCFFLVFFPFISCNVSINTSSSFWQIFSDTNIK